jgi:hypothetical protein
MRILEIVGNSVIYLSNKSDIKVEVRDEIRGKNSGRIFFLLLLFISKLNVPSCLRTGVEISYI